MKGIRLPPVGFWSYARQDDELSQGKLSTLRSLLMRELQQQYGRDPIQIFQDASTIPHGAAWEQEIGTALGKSTFFIPIVTPNFIQSDWCCREVTVFLEREAELYGLYPDLPQRSRIFPIQFVNVGDVDPADPAALAALKNLQWFDFRRFRHRSYESEPVREAIDELAASIRQLLNIRVEDPAVALARAREAEEAAERARHEEEARAALEREQEARRRREEARIRAEAARERAEQAAVAARKRAEEAAEAARLQAEAAEAAARVLAEEEEAAERARLEAELAAHRLTSGRLATAELVHAESEAAVERARLDSEAAERERLEKEAAAQWARAESEAAAERERVLAQEAAAAAAAAQERWQPAPPASPWLRPPVLAGLATALLAVLLIYMVWPVLPTPDPARATGPAGGESAVASPAAAPQDTGPTWLNGQWGLEGDCRTLVTLTARPGRLSVDFDGTGHSERIVASAADLVVTDRARYVRSREGLDVSEAAEAGRNDYHLARCGP